MRPLPRLALLALALVLSGCASVILRFPQDVAASFAKDDMRRMETEHLELYYPAAHQEAATTIAARLEQCATKLRAMETTQRRRDKFLVFMTSSDFNNAYVQPTALGLPQMMVLPVHMTLDLFDLYGVGTNTVGDVSCHEAVHYVTFEQVEGFWRGLNAVTGGVLSPQSFVDSWVHEGMATYYEARLGRPIGRPRSPFYRGVFAAGLASEEGLDAGYLNSNQRMQNPYGPSYLTGLEFTEYLARTYGEEKLWQLIDKQGRSIFSPFGLTLRFKSVYGQSIGALFDDFVAERKAKEAQRKRPADQRVLEPDFGTAGRIAVSRDGKLIASVSSGRDEPSRLILRDREGKVVASRRLTNVLPFRKTIVASPTVFSGLSFSPDGKWLYLVGADLDSVGSFVSKLWQVDTSDGSLERIVADDLSGFGGCATADGKGYVYVNVSSDRASLVRLDLEDGKRTTLWEAPPATSITAPACSPDGTRVAFAQRGEHGLDLRLLASDGTVAWLTEDGHYNTLPRWLDAGRLVFVREEEARSQAFVMEVASKALWPTTDAPFGVIYPEPFGPGEIAFLNLDGWGLSLDAAKVAAAPQGPARTAQAPEPPVEFEAGFLASAAAATDPKEGAPAALSSRVEPTPPLVVQRDEPYSPIDHLFVPSFRVPFLAFFPPGSFNESDTDWRLLVALSISGSDRLGKHNWAINVSYDTKDNGPSATLTYANYQLAPWLIDLNGALVNLGPAYDRYAQLGASREFWTTPLRLRVTGIDHHDLTDDGTQVLGRYRFVGPGLMFAYGAGESTPYGGVRRGLAFAASGDWYPKFAASDFDLGDVAAEVDFWVPLPFSRRHSLSITGRGRALIAAEEHPLLDVGGVYRGSSLFAWKPNTLVPKLRASDLQLFGAPEIAFSEALRGYPDIGTSASAYAAASASYVYPFIVDHGWASLLYVLPAFFIRQVDLELFGEMAWLWPGTLKRRSAGVALHLRTNLGNLPLSLFVEGTWRFDTHRKPLVVVGFSLD